MRKTKKLTAAYILFRKFHQYKYLIIALFPKDSHLFSSKYIFDNRKTALIGVKTKNIFTLCFAFTIILLNQML